MAKLRLLKVIVQAVIVVDDGENLVEQATEPVAVSATDWPTYATTSFVESFEGLRQQVESPAEVPAPKPNRAARRHPPKSAPKPG